MKKTVLAVAATLLLAMHLCAQQVSHSLAGGSEQQHFFIGNSGQWPEEVLFLTRTGRMDTWITRKGIVYDLYQLSPALSAQAAPASFPPGYPDGHMRKQGQVIRINYVGSSAYSGSGTKALPGYYNYLQGKDPSHWVTGVQRYEEVSVPGIYPGVDVHYYFEGGALRYDFIVHPGANIHSIRMEVEGTSGNPSTAESTLVIPTRFGDMKQDRLFTYQLIGGQQRAIRNNFVCQDNIVSFQIGNFDPRHDLIIDPVVWSTFIGGAGNEQIQGIDVDASGNICLAGISNAGTYPVTSGVYDLTYNGAAYDVIASKLNPSGTTLLFSTFIGGTGQDNANGLKVDASGNFYIAGTTTSIDFPTTGGAMSQVPPGGTSDGFITKLNSSGTALVYSTYIGSTGQDVCNAIAINGSGNVYVTGSTTSTAFPVTSGAYDLLHNGGGTDVFISELNTAGSALVYSSFMGGASGEVGNAVAVDASGNAFVTGYTASSNFPTTVGAYSQTNMGGASEGFIAKFNASGSALLYSTHIGGSSDDRPMGIAVDASGNAYITGYTYSTTTMYPVTVGAYDQTYNGGTCDIVVTKLNAAGSALVYSTYIGGSGNDFATGISLDASGNAVITGYTASGNYPTTAGSQDQTYNGGTYDVGVTRLNAAGSALLYSTYLGGALDEYGTAIISESTGGGAFVTGSTGSSAFPVTSGVYDQSFNSGSDVFVTKLLSCTPPAATAGSNSPVCSGQTINLTSSGGASYLWTGPNGFTSTQQNPVISAAATANSGTYSVTVTNASGCAVTATVSVNVGPSVGIASNSPVCAGQALNLTSSGGVSYSWSGPNAFTSTQQNPTVSGITAAGSGTYTVSVTDGSGCVGTGTISVTVLAAPVATAGASGPVCAGQTLSLSSSGGVTYAWSGPNGFSSTQQNPSVTGTTVASSGTYTVTVTNASGCSSTATVSAVVNVLPTATASSNGPICTTQSLNLISAGGTSYAWSGPNSFTSTLQTPSITNVSPVHAGTYSVTVTNAAGCTATATVNVIVNTTPAATGSSNSPICSGQNANLVSSGGSTYSWAGPGGFSSTQQNPVITGATLSSSGTYTVTVTAVNGCTASSTVSVVVNALPNAAVSTNSPVCAGQVLSLTANGGNTYAWSGPAAFSSTQQTNTISNAAGVNAGTYSVTVTNVNSCTATATVNVVVNTLPVVLATTNSPVCEGGSVMLGANGGVSYAWSGPGNFSATQQNASLPAIPAATGAYSVSATDANGCMSSDTVMVVVHAAPVGTALANGPLCAGTTLLLSASGGQNYSWTGPSAFSSTLQNPAINSITPLEAGTYSVIVSDVNSCTDTATVTVIVNTVDTSVTPNGSVLTASASGAAYQWIDCSTQQIISGATGQTYNAVQSGQYAVIVTENGCSDTSSCHQILSLGISGEQTAAGINVFPNPGDGLFHIQLNDAAEIHVYDLTGRLVFSDAAKQASVYALPLEQPAGVYVLEVTTLRHRTQVRLVIKD